MKLSSKSWESLAAGVDVGERPIAEAGGGFGSLVLVVGHFSIYAAAGAVGLFVVAIWGIARELGVAVGGHCEGEEVGEGGMCFEVEVE